jgi:hypothetical protein
MFLAAKFQAGKACSGGMVDLHNSAGAPPGQSPAQAPWAIGRDARHRVVVQLAVTREQLHCRAGVRHNMQDIHAVLFGDPESDGSS